VIFDDSKTHWAENNSDEDRIILIIDIPRPYYVKPGNSDVEQTGELKKNSLKNICDNK
jgi:aspartyl/asparaginyl beta-hydroxylase (cupin superfamily)